MSVLTHIMVTIQVEMQADHNNWLGYLDYASRMTG
jgi:hypothetical protein